MKIRKKLIEVALPLEKINEAAAREKSIRHGHPSTLHLWWARRPLAAARAVIFSQMVDDPSSHPEMFPTEEAQEAERQRLFAIIENLVKWENTANERILTPARTEIRKSWSRFCKDNHDHPQAAELFDPDKLPAFHDPFAGGGALPLEAQRLGLVAWASDLNPVAVTINKAMIEIPPKFSGRKPVGPLPQGERQASIAREWPGASGLGEDVRRYGAWMRSEAEERIGHLYPKVEVSAEIARQRPDLEPLMGQKLTVIAWLWARTVKSPDPAFADVDVPLASTFILSSKPGKEAYVEPLVTAKSYTFDVKVGKAPDKAANGTKASGRGANFVCLLSGTPISGSYIKTEAQAGRMGSRLMAIVAEGPKGRLYFPPNSHHELIAQSEKPSWKPDVEFFQQALGFRVGNYGMRRWSDLFTDRQLIALSTLADLAKEAPERITRDAVSAGMLDDGIHLHEGGYGATAYGEAVAIYLAFLVDQQSNQSSTCCGWNNINQQMIVTFSMQALQMKWDFAECNLLSQSTGSFTNLLERQVKAFTSLVPEPGSVGFAFQQDAASVTFDRPRVICTDPPYYDNIGYADLSEFFYVWLRHSLHPSFPNLFATVGTPKMEELVATPSRHGGREQAETFFLAGMKKAMKNIAQQANAAFPIAIFYAFRQSETNEQDGTSSTGWETFLESIIQAGLVTTGTWPVKTESANKLKAEKNALASSIVLVCRKREANAPVLSKREFLSELKAELPKVLLHLQYSNIAPVDLQQAAIGPGMAIYSRCSSVINAAGEVMRVNEALKLINETLDEVLAEQEGDFDTDTRWAVAWYDQRGFDEGTFGEADVLSRAKNTSVEGMKDAGILKAGAGKVRLLRPEELDLAWSPETDARQPVWETLHHLIRVLNRGGEVEAAALIGRLGNRADAARELAYRLYLICERKKRAQDALTYNALVQSWPEMKRLASEDEQNQAPVQQSTMFS